MTILAAAATLTTIPCVLIWAIETRRRENTS